MLLISCKIKHTIPVNGRQRKYARVVAGPGNALLGDAGDTTNVRYSIQSSGLDAVPAVEAILGLLSCGIILRLPPGHLGKEIAQ